SRVGIIFSSRRTRYFCTLFLLRLLFAPKISRPDKSVATYRIGVTTTSRRDVTADVVDPQHGWHVLPQVFQGHTLHLFIHVNGLGPFCSLRRLVQQTIYLLLPLGFCGAERMPFAAADVATDFIGTF